MLSPGLKQAIATLEPISLELGASGAAVAALQRVLSLFGYALPISGYFDANTQVAVQALQRHYNLPTSGRFNPQTWYALHFGLPQAGAGDRRPPTSPALLSHPCQI